MDNLLTELQAFKIMQIFLEHYYNINSSDDLGSLLSSLQLFPDGGTLDPAMWQEWLDAIGSDKNLTTLMAFNAMKKFLENYCNYIDSEDIQELLNVIQSALDNKQSIVWKQWQSSINKVVKIK